MNKDKTFTKLGIALSIYVIASSILSVFAVQIVKTHITEDLSVNILFSFLTQYLVGVPILIYLLSAVPKVDIPKYRLKIKDVAKLFIMLFPLLASGSLLGNLLNSIISKLLDIKIPDIISFIMLRVNPVILILFVGIIGPIIEEYINRKLLIDRVVNYGEGVAVFISATVFALMHGNFYQSFYAFMLGAVFAYVYIKTGKLRYSAIMHIMVNSSSVLMVILLKGSGLYEIMTEASGEYNNMDPAVLEEMMSNLTMTNGLCIIAMFIGALIYVIFLIVGIVFWFKHSKSFHLKSGSMRMLSTGEKAKTIFLNFGMIMFLLISIYNFADSIFQFHLGL